MKLYAAAEVLNTSSCFLMAPFRAIRCGRFLVDTEQFVLVMFTNFCTLIPFYQCSHFLSSFLSWVCTHHISVAYRVHLTIHGPRVQTRVEIS